MAWHTGEGMGWWMLFGGLLSVVVWGAVIYLVVTLIRAPTRGRHPIHDDPVEILKRRYASGEIDRDEYERVRRDLAA